ncbi:MAG: LiaI-LiaF-like domain-containing protein, partial [Terriglobia bacterium]
GECRRDVRGAVYCEDCLAALTATSSTTSGAPNPGAALALGFIPSVGAIYNGEYAKGLIHILIFGGLVSWVAAGEPLLPLAIVSLVGFICYMPLEAYQTAKRRAAGLAPAPTGLEATMKLSFGNGGRATPIGPLILIVVGVILLINTLDVFHFHWVRLMWRFWPLALIGLGAWLLWQRTGGSAR